MSYRIWGLVAMNALKLGTGLLQLGGAGVGAGVIGLLALGWGGGVWLAGGGALLYALGLLTLAFPD